jgi:uncharacterized protein YjbJ (UPF0337 family)
LPQCIRRGDREIGNLTTLRKGISMNKDQVKGRVEQAKGSVKEATGKVVGNDNLQAEGQIDKAAGKAQATYGDVKENVKDAVKKQQQP